MTKQEALEWALAVLEEHLYKTGCSEFDKAFREAKKALTQKEQA